MSQNVSTRITKNYYELAKERLFLFQFKELIMADLEANNCIASPPFHTEAKYYAIFVNISKPEHLEEVQNAFASSKSTFACLHRVTALGGYQQYFHP